MSDIIKWLAELTPEGKKTVIAMLRSDTPEPEKTEVRKTSGLYQKVYGSKFKEIYDKIECSGKPIRGSGHQLTPTEFKKIVNRCHSYAKEQRELGFPDEC